MTAVIPAAVLVGFLGILSLGLGITALGALAAVNLALVVICASSLVVGAVMVWWSTRLFEAAGRGH